MLDTPAGWTPPKVFEEYRILRLLGRGGMGEVYLAHDTVLDRHVAVKFVSKLDPDAVTRQQLIVEARAAARVQHPNVLTIYRVGELENRPYIVSEFLRGKSLDHIPVPMPWESVLELSLSLVRGLSAAHRRGVLHRDIKPANAVITDDGEVKLLDFGLAKLIDISALQDERGSVAPLTLMRVAPDAETISMLPPALAAEAEPAGLFEGPVSDVYSAPPASGVRGNSAALEATLPCINRRTMQRDEEAPASGESFSSLTMVRGTPHYMAPEIWRCEPASRRSDIYSLGALLYELCAGYPPNAAAPLHELPRVAQRNDAPPLASVAPSVDPQFAALIDRCLRRDPAERFASGDELREALEQLTLAARRDAIPDGNPYRGLLPFEAEHRTLFFGRDTEIGTLLDRLRSEPFLLVAGDSGVGKSSLCRAGVLPLVLSGAFHDGRVWSEARLVPGRNPLAAFVSALAGPLDYSPKKLEQRIRTSPGALARELVRHLGDNNGIIIFIDQLEELATLSDTAEAEIVGRALAELTAGLPGVRVLMTVRSDFLSRVASLPGLGDELARALYLLRPLSADKIREAIVGPARVKGVAFESEALIDDLVGSMARGEGSLPLLQFALAEIWDARVSSRAAITAAALQVIGGVSGALARHADQVFLSLPGPQRAAARRILISLVTLEGTRVHRTEEELVLGKEEAREALAALVRGRLLLARDDEQGTAYEVAHEALLKGWHTLRRWLDDQAESRVEKNRLELAAAEWERLGCTREALWSARQLAESEILEAEDLTPRELAFLAASRRAIRTRSRVRRALIAAVPITLAVLYGVIQLKTHREIDRRVAFHTGAAQIALDAAAAQDGELEKLRLQAFAAFDAKQREEGERLWARTLELSREVDRAYGRASQAFEAALTIDASRADVRYMLGDVLQKRALVAERDHRPEQREDLLQRLALYDVSGEHRRRFHSPAHLSIETSPPGAQITLERLTEDDGHGITLAESRAVGASPSAEIEAPRGSYVVVLTHPGRVTVRYPVLLGRDERLRIAVDLPKIEAIPQGFIYIPPGRFLFGSSADEQQRREFFNTVPAHEVTTGAYLIARHETTYAEWLEYLKALPPEERARRTPKVSEVGFAGALELRELPDGKWRLTFQPTTEAHTALQGEPIHYRARSHRVEQSWARMPVSALSSEDAAAYAAWLDATGRVPGARFCTEHEWERAARGADEREFPAGETLAADDANFDETYGKEAAGWGPDEVGAHPGSRSPFGLDDMAGNIFEWTTSSLAPGENVIRGGAYYYGQMTAQSTNRSVIFDSKLRDPRLGVRICATVNAQ